MGLDINVKKPIRFLGTERPDDEEINYVYLYTLDFAPIEHLPNFKRGYWEFEYCGAAQYSSPYGTFNDLRDAITLAVYKCKYAEFIRCLENGSRAFEGPFIEMLWFADNEGNFDYEIARKLLADFLEWEDKIIPTMDRDYLKECYRAYIGILRDCVECDGVVDYH